MTPTPRILVIGAGVGGLTTAALLAKAGFDGTVLEAQTYPGGSAGTFFHQGYCFEAGATVVGGFQPNGPHAIAAQRLGIQWDARLHDPAWVVHLPDRSVALTRDNHDVIAQFPQSAHFWRSKKPPCRISAGRCRRRGCPFPPADATELTRLIKVGGKFSP
ncbi:MAG: FAD-dependent oxidoreductase [Anaerolineae bacterium]